MPLVELWVKDSRHCSEVGTGRSVTHVSFTAFLLLPLLSACGKASAPAAAVTRTDSAGVEVVTNSAFDRLLGWSLDSVLDVRSPTGTGGDTAGFFNVTDVTTTGGRIVVLDGLSPALFVYDSLGHLQGRHGRKGQGPGEFQHPSALATTVQGGVGVFDVGNHRIELFDTSFASSGSISLGTVPARGAAMRFAGDAAVLTTFRIRGDTTFDGLSAIGPTGAEAIATLPRPIGKKPIDLKSCGLWVRPGFWPQLFAPSLHWATDREGSIMLAKGDRYDIGVYGGSPFALTKRIRRDLPVIQATKELAVKSLGEGMKQRVDGAIRVCDPEEQVEQQGFASTVPPLEAMIVSPNGDIWAKRWVLEGDPSLIDVFDSTGVYRGTLRGEPMPTAFLSDDHVIVKRTDAMDVSFLTIYRVVR